MTKLKTAFANPALIAYGLWAKLNRRSLFNRYDKLSRLAGLDKVYFILSFDCDTTDDIDVVWNVHSRLIDMGIKPVYAVPGELLNRGEKVYRRISETGGEFINHGYRQHTYFDTNKGRHRSCFFYDELTLEGVRDDIIQGDVWLKQVLGMDVRGFRAPHFGTFQKPHQLRFLHSVLHDLGYIFSTSTVPLYAFRYGPIFRSFGAVELPVSGMANSPLNILDSWSCFMAPDRTMTPQDYLREGEAISKLFKVLGVGLLNFYADPIHIHDSDIFFETVSHWRSVAVAVTYSKLLERLP
jgi:hypothetical protein